MNATEDQRLCPPWKVNNGLFPAIVRAMHE